MCSIEGVQLCAEEAQLQSVAIIEVLASKQQTLPADVLCGAYGVNDLKCSEAAVHRLLLTPVLAADRHAFTALVQFHTHIIHFPGDVAGFESLPPLPPLPKLKSTPGLPSQHCGNIALADCSHKQPMIAADISQYVERTSQQSSM